MLAGRSVFAGFRSKAGRFGCSAATASRVGARPGVRRLARAAIPERVKPSDHSSSPFHELGLFDIWDGLGTTRARQHVNPLRAEFQSPIGPVDWSQVYEDPTRPLVLDLGCGPGRFLLLLNHKSMPADDVIKAAGGANYLGIEIRRSMVERSNIWAERMGVHKTCCFLYTNATVCYIQFPDPHFKKRYHKRRIFQPNLIKTLKDALPVGGRLFLQSDVLKVSVAMRNMFEYYAADAFALAPEHVPTDPADAFVLAPEHISIDPRVVFFIFLFAYPRIRYPHADSVPPCCDKHSRTEIPPALAADAFVLAPEHISIDPRVVFFIFLFAYPRIRYPHADSLPPCCDKHSRTEIPPALAADAFVLAPEHISIDPRVVFFIFLFAYPRIRYPHAVINTQELKSPLPLQLTPLPSPLSMSPPSHRPQPDAFALAPEHVPTDPSVVFYQEPGQGDGETDAPTRSPIPSSSTPTARLEAAVLASDSHVNTAWRSESSEGAEGSDVDGSDGSEGSKGSEGSNGSEELDQDRSDEEDSPCRLPRRVREADTDNIVSEWSKGGWLVDNPIGVPTEREVYVGQQGMPVYRILLERK
eukprot:gene8292-1563_t